MVLQFGHTKDYDYENELYVPIKTDLLFKEHRIILPHAGESINTRNTLPEVDIFFAEVSYPSTGLGIELGFASILGTKVICFYKKWVSISESLRLVCDDFFEYADKIEMIQEIWKRIHKS